MAENLRVMILEDVATDAELIEHELRKDGIDFLFYPGRNKIRVHQWAPTLQAGADPVRLRPSFLRRPGSAKDRQGGRPDTPFIFVSGTLGEERAIETLKTGATDYVLKQRLSRLAPVVRRALQETKERTASKQLEAEPEQTLGSG